MASFEELKASEKALLDAVDSLIVLTNEIAAKLAALVAAGGATPDQLQSVKDELDAERAKVQAAIAADTPPPAPAPPPAP